MRNLRAGVSGLLERQRGLVLCQRIEGEGAGEIIQRHVGQSRLAYAPAPLERVCPPGVNGRVGDLPVVGGGAGVAHGGAAAEERSLHTDCRRRVGARVMDVRAQVLEPGFVDGLRVDHRGLGSLHGVLGLPLFVSARRQVEISHPLIVQADAQFLVTHGQRVLAVDCVIQPRAEGGPRLGRRQCLVDLERVQIAVERGGEHECVFGDVATLRVECERSFVAPQRTVEVEAVDLGPIRRPCGLGEQRVARVQRGVVELHEGLAVEEVGSGFGEDLDARETGPIALGGERVGIDAHFADGGFRRQPATRKAVDKKLAAAGTGSGTGQRLQL